MIEFILGLIAGLIVGFATCCCLVVGACEDEEYEDDYYGF
jgi:hypothetical protein